MGGRLIILGALLVAGIVEGSPAEEKPVRSSEIPRVFRGEYAWREGAGTWQVPSKVTLTIETIVEKNGMIEFSGSDVYVKGNEYKMKVTGKIDPQWRFLTMKETAASSPSGVTDGSYEGTISRDLQTIEAVWTTTGTGKKGDLYLTTGEMKGLPWENGRVLSNGFNEAGGPFKDYDAKIVKAVKERWYALIDRFGVYSHHGWVTVDFEITNDGKVENVKAVDTSPEMKRSVALQELCEKAVVRAAPFDPRPASLRALVGPGPRHASITFRY